MESRNKREGVYSGRQKGKHHRWGNGYGFKKIPLNPWRACLKMPTSFGIISGCVMYIHK